jgi:hypothetical protein
MSDVDAFRVAASFDSIVVSEPQRAKPSKARGSGRREARAS